MLKSAPHQNSSRDHLMENRIKGEKKRKPIKNGRDTIKGKNISFLIFQRLKNYYIHCIVKPSDIEYLLLSIDHSNHQKLNRLTNKKES